MAVRIADIRDSTVLVRRITTLKSLLCASPDFIARDGSPTSVAELPHYSCLAHLGSDEHDRVWTFAGHRGASIRVDGSFDSNSALALRKAALAGLGIALLPEEYISADLASGALMRILPQYEVRRPVTALYARSPHIPQKVRLLVSFLVQWFKNERAHNCA